MKKEARIPTFVGIILLFVAVAGGVILTQATTSFGSKASGTCQPVSSQVANITQNSADISFTTSMACSISVVVGSQTLLDNKPSIVHYFQAKHLQPQTKYSFSIVSSGQTIAHNDYVFTTGSSPQSSLPTSNLAWGRVLNSDGKTPANAIVYLNIPGAAPLSSFVSSDGNWSISLASSLNDVKTDWFSPPISGIDEDITVLSSDGQTTQITNNTLVNNPVPDIIIGVNSFTAPTPVVSTFNQSVGVGLIGTVSPAQIQNKLAITNPQENESITTARPDFFGTAPINTIVNFTFDSGGTPFGQTTSDSSGNWHWSPTSDIPLGNHSLSAKIQDSTSLLWTTVTRKFTVLAATSSIPQYVASGSATPVNTPTDTPIPTAIQVAHPSTSSPPPVTGETLPTVLIIASAMVFFLVSFTLLK